MQKLFIPFLALAVILGFLFWKFGPSGQNQLTKGPVTVNYWGFWSNDFIAPVIAEFEKSHPNIKINYSAQNLVNYRLRVQNQISQGSGPDIFKIHNSWLTMFDGFLAPAPEDIFTLAEYRNSFYPILEDSFIKGQKIYGASAEIDGLALYVNEEILQAAGVLAPTNWQQFTEAAVKMTVKDTNGQIKTAGAALGTTSNIDYWSEILGLLFLQEPNVNLNSPTSRGSIEVISFFTSFMLDPRRKIWDSSLPSSTQSFIDGQLFFYFGPSSKIAEIKQKNPNLRFSIVAVPQLPGKQVAWASFWGEGVSSRSKHPKEAWQFIKFLTSIEAQKILASQSMKLNGLNWLSSRRNLLADVALDPSLNAFLAQGGYYKFWYLNSQTGDLGINDGMVKYFGEAVNNTLLGQDPTAALQAATPKIAEIYNQFTKPAPAPSGK